MMNHENKIDEVGCIVGAVIQVNPSMEASVQTRIKQYEAIEVHAKDEKSRWVITLEAATSKKLLQLSEDIQNMDGVLSMTPVYQHCEENQSLEKQDGGWKWR